MNGAQSVLEVRGVSFCYPDGTPALQNVTLAVPAGKKTAFLGPNGAGKTTLFLHFNGILRPQQGKVYFAGREVRYNHASLLELRKNVGIVFQDPETQLFSASVRQDVSFGPLNLGLPAPKVKERVEEALAATGMLGLQDRPTHFLSYGQKKLAAIAGVLAMRPRVLICDEPTAWLDTKNAAQIMDLFEQFNRAGTTVIFSTHDVDLAYARADYLVVLKNGRVAGAGEPAEIFRNSAVLAAAGLEKPWVMDVCEELQRKGWVAGTGNLFPRTKQELLLCIGGEGKRRGGGPAEGKRKPVLPKVKNYWVKEGEASLG